MKKDINPRYVRYPQRKEVLLDVVKKVGVVEAPEEEIKKADEADTSIDLNNNLPTPLKVGDYYDG
ncbi:hypothetical protein SCG7109_AB_00320 [Chlamydiales bacterium SCGC AG-110-M15]|nr:hypothetical protein SCG7109_AB_00320 [Chlamydiales bacterium SCGC AG-110-M15]